MDTASDPPLFDRLVMAHAGLLCGALLEQPASEACLTVLLVPPPPRPYLGPSLAPI